MEMHTSHAVLWQAGIDEMIRIGVDTIVELGPSHGLTNFNKKCLEGRSLDISLYNVQTSEDMDVFVEEFHACRSGNRSFAPLLVG